MLFLVTACEGGLKIVNKFEKWNKNKKKWKNSRNNCLLRVEENKFFSLYRVPGQKL